MFVRERGGDAGPILSILVANNGIAAVKFMRSVRKWAYATFGSEKAISLVAMATHDDIRSNAEHISMADQFVEVPGGASANNYGNVKLIAQTAERAGVDAVWPGWCAAPNSVSPHNSMLFIAYRSSCKGSLLSCRKQFLFVIIGDRAGLRRLTDDSTFYAAGAMSSLLPTSAAHCVWAQHTTLIKCNHRGSVPGSGA